MIDFTLTISTLHKKLFIAIAALFVFSLALYIIFYPGSRKLFLFESLDKSALYAEARYIPRKHFRSSMRFFTYELLLGPQSDRYRPLFAQGTRALDFFKGADGVLYVNLNEKAVLQNGSSSATHTACKLLAQNLRKNYNVHAIEITMMGHEIYVYEGGKSRFYEKNR